MKNEIGIRYYELNDLILEDIRYAVCKKCKIGVLLLRRRDGLVEVLDYPDKSSNDAEGWSVHECGSRWDPDLRLCVSPWLEEKMQWNKDTMF